MRMLPVGIFGGWRKPQTYSNQLDVKMCEERRPSNVIDRVENWVLIFPHTRILLIYDLVLKSVSVCGLNQSLHRHGTDPPFSRQRCLVLVCVTERERWWGWDVFRLHVWLFLCSSSVDRSQCLGFLSVPFLLEPRIPLDNELTCVSWSSPSLLCVLVSRIAPLPHNIHSHTWSV